MLRAWGDPSTWSKVQHERFIARSRQEEEIVQSVERHIELIRALGHLDDVNEGKDGALVLAYHYGFHCGQKAATESNPTPISEVRKAVEEFRVQVEEAKARLLAGLSLRINR
jgi:hypothetical protein